MLKRLTIACVAALFAAGVFATGAQAGGKKTAIGIAVGVAATALILSAAQSANSYRDRDYYDYNQSVGPNENAVAACIHRADRRVQRRRGGFARLEHVKDVKHKDGRIKVTMLVTNISGRHARKRWVKCHVRHDRVVFFKYN